MRALITGCGGFIGSHLADFLLEKGIEVTGTIHVNEKNLDHLKDKIKIIKCDISKKHDVEKLIDDYDFVFHMAAQSFVMPSWKDPEETFSTNIMGTHFLLDGFRKSGFNPVICVACSSAEYGLTHENEIPINEHKEFRPSSPYAVSKVTQDMLSYLYYQAFGMKIIRMRFFNTVGPRKIRNACADFAKGIVEIEKGKKTELSIGNMKSIVDITDIKDALDAIWVLANSKRYGDVFNICSGNGIPINEILKKFISMSKLKIKTIHDQSKMRPFDDPIFIGDNSKLQKLGWQSKIPFEKTLSDILEYWRKEAEAYS